ncbi:MAG: TonB-dependent receptor [Niabella sp.]|nr:MAG: TonB-dependent receptor [Niabella sp.]
MVKEKITALRKKIFLEDPTTLNSSLSLQPVKNLVLIPSVHCVGKRKPGTYDIGPDPMKPYSILNFYAAYTFVKKVKLFADFKNLTNKKYFDAYGYNSARFNFLTGVSVSL